MALERQIEELQTELKTAVSEKQRIESSVNSQLQLLQEQLNLERTRSKVCFIGSSIFFFMFAHYDYRNMKLIVN